MTTNLLNRLEEIRTRQAAIRKMLKILKNSSPKGLPKAEETVIISNVSGGASEANKQRRDAAPGSVSWITVNGVHIPLNSSGEAVGGPSALQGRNFSGASSTPSGSSKKSMSAKERAAYSGPRGANDERVKAALGKSSTNTSDRGKDDSLAKYCDEDGNLSTEREQLHEELVEKAIANAIPEESPTFLMMGGGPAAGKGTIQDSETFIEKYGAKEDRVTIDSDEFKKGIPEYQEMTAAKDENAAGYAHEESSALAKRAMSVLNESSCSYTLDGTGDGSVKSLNKKIDEARAAGMTVNAVYVTCDTNVAVQRAVARGQKTGRYVNEDTVRGTHKKVSQILPQCASKFDSGELYDTSGSSPVLIATFGGGKGLTATSGNEDKLQRFLDKANE